jgi:hypothetical protein
MIYLGLFPITLQLYDLWSAWHSSEFSLNVPVAIYVKGTSLNIKDYQKIIAISEDNEENSPTFDRRVSPLVGAATHKSNVWVLSVKGRKKEKYIAYHLVLEHI